MIFDESLADFVIIYLFNISIYINKLNNTHSIS